MSANYVQERSSLLSKRPLLTRGKLYYRAKPATVALLVDQPRRLTIRLSPDRYEVYRPDKNTLEDGYAGTAPAKSYEPNAYGIYNTSGNVWEWCTDWSSRVPKPMNKLDPEGPPEGTSKVTKGGSYLCHASYCNRYRVSARSSATPDSSTGNMGFRTVAL